MLMAHQRLDSSHLPSGKPLIANPGNQRFCSSHLTEIYPATARLDYAAFS
jgi:hypothetical protein